MTTITLRSVVASDLPIFFAQQADPAAIRMAAFTAEGMDEWDTFDTRWKRFLADRFITIRTIFADGAVAGSVLSYEADERREVSYWLGREFWGRGIATASLAAFLREETARPIYARVAVDNVASLRVLEKNGFVVAGRERGFAHGRGEEVEEFVLVLGAATR
jgi:RimJ/RimL family protein N-acetyltransferase